MEPVRIRRPVPGGIFYHFTSAYHLESITASGVIIPSESNIGSPDRTMPPYGPHLGPDVVWLLDTPDPYAFDHGLTGSLYDKRMIRIGVRVPAIKWTEWAPAERMSPEWRSLLIKAGGGPDAADHWYIWPSPIRRGRWTDIESRTEIS